MRSLTEYRNIDPHFRDTFIQGSRLCDILPAVASKALSMFHVWLSLGHGDSATAKACWGTGGCR